MSAQPLYGNHGEFVDLYETYLDVVYGPEGTGVGSGRWKLMRSLAAELRKRDATRVLDCAAGVGFPMVDLAVDSPDEFEIHCSDGDPLMIETLVWRAKQLGLDASAMAPLRRPDRSDRPESEALVLNWNELDDIDGQYDYVLCRGNSLAYADTWDGRRRTASDSTLNHYLRLMVGKVKPGGFLHVDAPRFFEQPGERHSNTKKMVVWEKVTAEDRCREWWVSFKRPDGATIVFKRYSSLLTIDRVEAALVGMGLTTERVELYGERPGFGVVLARRPR